MAISLDAAAATMRDAMRQTVRRYSLWYLVQGMLMVVTGVLALIYPWIASVAMVRLLHPWPIKRRTSRSRAVKI